MGRPKASPDQQVIALELHRQGLKPRAISLTLEKEFDEPVSLSTVEKWCRKFRDNPTGDAFLDSPFNWEQMDKAGIPWEAGSYLLDVWGKLRKGINRPSFRHMRWWWRVHLAVPNSGFAETMEMVLAIEVAENDIENQDELYITKLLSNGTFPQPKDDPSRGIRETLFRVRSEKLLEEIKKLNDEGAKQLRELKHEFT